MYGYYLGKNPFIWFGRKPRVIITEPELIKEVLNKIYAFPKPDTNPLVKLVATGLINYEGEKWNKHRRIVSPAFNMEKLKVRYEFIFSCINTFYTVSTTQNFGRYTDELFAFWCVCTGKSAFT